MTDFINRQVIDNYGLIGSEWGILRELHGYFTQHVPEVISIAQNALKNKDTKLLQEQLHSLKNLFVNMGALVVAEECQGIEDQLDVLAESEVSVKLDLIFERFKDVQCELDDLLVQEERRALHS